MEKVCVIRGRETLSASHLAKRKFTFLPSSSSSLLAFFSQLTKIVILLRNHIYMFLLPLRAPLGVLVYTVMADFLNNSFISFYDVHVFQEFASIATLRTEPRQLMCRGYAGKNEKFNNNFMTLWQSARSKFLFTARAPYMEERGKIHWKTFRISFSLSDFSFPFSQDIYSPVSCEKAHKTRPQSSAPAKAGRI